MCTTNPTVPARQQRLKKQLGQHFLKDDSVCKKMVQVLDTTRDDAIVEIGPGAGALTRILEQLPHSKLLLLEKDSFWAEERQKNAARSTYCVLQDALTFDFTRVPGWILVGNLPYNIASPLLWTIAQDARPKQALFMVQKEVANRICACPGTKAYGALSIWIQTFLTPRMLFSVSPRAFYPEPKVDSGVVFFLPKDKPPKQDLFAPLSRILHVFFQKRRKQLGTICRQAGLPGYEDAFRELGLSPTMRPEEIPVEIFAALATFFHHVLTDTNKIR